MATMKDSIDYAMEIAHGEAAAGNKVMVLFPNSTWWSAALPQPKDIYLRASTIESGLKMVSIDTLILVGHNLPEWDEKGERYARERLRTSRDPRVIIAEKDR